MKKDLEVKNENFLLFLKKPSWLDSKKERKFVKLIASKKLNEFYDSASKSIKSSDDVRNLYIYLDGILSSSEKNQEFLEHVCSSIDTINRIGWIGLKDEKLVSYCKKNSKDKFLLKSLKDFKKVKWFEKYLENYFPLEKKIERNERNIEKNVEAYFDFIKDLKKKKQLEEEKFKELMEILEKNVSLFKGESLIGYLISKKLQKKLNFKQIGPKLKLNQKDTIGEKLITL